MRKRITSLVMMAALAPLLVASLAARPAYEPAAPLDDKSIDAVAKLVYPAVVKVEARNGMRKIATGVVMDKDGYIVTTALISPHDEEITVITLDGKRIKADFVGLDSQTRLAVLKAKEKLPASVALGKTEGLGPGAWIGVVSISPENTAAVTQGIVSSVATDWLRLNVWVMRGASGSPVINKDGQMIGLLRGAYFEDNPVLFEFREQQVVGSGYAFSRAETPASGMAQAIPIEIVKDVYGQIKDKGKVERGWLGVNARENDEGQVEVIDVEDGSPASLAKLKEGDVILKLDGKAITGPEVLTSEIRMRKPGKDIVLQVKRGDKPLDIKVKLGQYSEQDARLEIERSFPQLFNFPPTQPAPGKVPAPSKGPLGPKAVQPKTGPMEKQPFPPGIVWEKRKFIGLYLSQTTKELAEFFGLKDGVGLLVNQFTENSPAQKAGLKVGDVIFKADGKRIQAVSDLGDILQDKKKGDKVKLELLRDKKPMSVDVEVGEEETQGPWGMANELFSKTPGSLESYRALAGSNSHSDSRDVTKKYDQFIKRYMDTSKGSAKAPRALRYFYSGNTYRI
jgi:serine protease Do